MKRILETYSISKKGKTEAFILSFFISILGLAIPIVMLQVYDRLLKHHSTSSAVVLVGGAFIAIAIESFLRYGRSYLLAGYSHKFDAEMPVNIMRRILNAPIVSIKSLGPQGINQTQNDLNILKSHYSGQSVIALFDLPFTVLYLLVVAYIGGVVVLVPIAIIIFAIFAALYLRNIAAKVVVARDYNQTVVQGKLLTLFSSLLQVKILGIEKNQQDDLSEASERYSETRRQAEILNLIANDSVAVLSQLSTVGIVIIGAIEVMNGNMTTGALAACTILGGRCIGPVNRLFAYWIRLQTTLSAKERIEGVEKIAVNKIFANDDSVLPAPKNGNVELKNVVFSVDNKSYEISLDIQSGMKYAMDASDGGIVRNKMILAFIGGFISPESGEVIVGGNPLNAYSRDPYCRSVALVTHDSMLFRGSLLDNMTFFRPELTEDAMIISEKIGLTPLISRLPYGFRTQVTTVEAPPVDQGTIQAIAIIRALARNPKILLLDRAESGFDLGGQKRFVELLKEMKDLTVIAQPVTKILTNAMDSKIKI
jgi:ATP-binding cassette subfamily C protein LapB